MTKPVRLRLSRRRGFKLQEHSHRVNGLDAVNVTRPSRWGNPYPVEQYGRQKAIALYRAHLQRELRAPDSPLDLSTLRGRNLACWCAPHEACHADVLLERANA